MDITWYGLSCFRIREGGVTVICDPFDKLVGLTLPKLRADVVTVSHDRPGHNAVDRVTGEPKILRGPGEYEVQNVFVTGLTTYHRRNDEHISERNVAFFFEFDGLTVGHLGDIGEVPAQSEIEELNIGEVDVLMVPVGGGDTLDPTRAVEVVGLFEPRVVIPMHYRHEGLASELAGRLESVDRFLKELGVAAPDPVDTLKISKSGLPEETQVALLSLNL
ncbi:MAG: MBL fold metallo-hydrolase [Caldilineaceae bacterium]|nr:MBL fold metallo-hydrolase [Caldilineaceae bacterium]